MSGLALVYQPFLLVFSDLPGPARRPASGASWARCVGRGLAVPLLLVFGALFAAADAVFAATSCRQMFAWLQDYPQLLAAADLEPDPELAGARLARRAFTAARSRPVSRRIADLRLPGLGALHRHHHAGSGGCCCSSALSLVQAVYLFGGADALARTGLTSSECAAPRVLRAGDGRDAGVGPDPVDGLGWHAFCDGQRPAGHQPAARR